MSLNKIGSAALYPVYQWMCDECFDKIKGDIEYTYIKYKEYGKCQSCGKNVVKKEKRDY